MFICYLLIFLVITAVVISLFSQQNDVELVKKYGTRTTGIIIENSEMNPRSLYRLGGNINYPIIQFTTSEGKEITGKPIMGFVTQHEVAVPSYINIIYDPGNPEKFCIDA